jgi:hypothetical protein
MIKGMRSRLSFVITGLLAGLLVNGAIAFAWNPAPPSPPSGNVSAPINVGATAQSKNGKLGVNELAPPTYPFEVVGDSLFQGRIQIPGSSGVINFGNTLGTGAGTEGFSDDGSGHMRYKDSSGAWILLNTLGSGSSQWLNGAPGTIYYNSGNVGIGIAAPTAKLHVVNANQNAGWFENNSATYAALIVRNMVGAGGYGVYDGSSAQHYFAGKVGIGTASPLTQLTVNSSWGAYALPEAFSIRGSYPSLTFRSNNLTVGSGGGVWLNHFATNGYLYWYNAIDGTDSVNWGPKMWLGPSGDLTTASSISASGNLSAGGTISTGGTVSAGYMYSNGSGIRSEGYPQNTWAGMFNFCQGACNNGQGTGNYGIWVSGSINAIYAYGSITGDSFIYRSDARYKHNVQNLDEGLMTLMKLRPVSFTWNDDAPVVNHGKGDIGFIAQEVQKILPDMVHTDATGHKGIDYVKLVPVLVKAVQEQQATIVGQQSKIDSLEERIAKLEAKIGQ